MRNRFDQQLELLNKQLIHMGELCEEAIGKATTALKEGNMEQAEKVRIADEEIDQAEIDIERLCLRLLLQQQPVARDLRQISAALKMITDMERIGDQAADICEIVTMMDGMEGLDNPRLMRDMAHETVDMVHKVIDAYVASDVHLAQAVMAADDVVDDLFMRVKAELIAFLTRDATRGQQALDILMIAKYFERIGDHAVNIGEWVEFSVTGSYKGEELQ